jgi:hypothetical protein
MNRSVLSGICLTAIAVSLAGCGSDKPPASGASSTAPSAAPASYSTKYLVVPVDATVPTWLDPTPTDDTAHFVTWGSSDGSRAVRILSPVVVYPPDRPQPRRPRRTT